jgi:broad-specificity NMP kinase
MKRLYLIGGPMGVGKTTVCQELKRLTAPSVFLDGDWCWDMEPFQVTEETKRMVQENIAFLLGQFLRCSAYETVIFCWVMHQQEILDSLLGALPLKGVEVRKVSLLAKPETLKQRIGGDVERGLRTWDVLDRSLERLPLYQSLDTEKLWVDRLSPREAAEILAK